MYLSYFVDNNIMESEMICDYCKQKTESLFGLFDMMVCSNCHIEVSAQPNLFVYTK
jgi:hypothetical protein